MDDAQDRRQETRPQTGGVVRDLNRLKSDGADTVAELRDFIGQMRGKSPQEMLGMVAKSGLMRSIVLATFLVALLLVALSVVPYYWHGPPAHAQQAAEEQTAVEEAAAPSDESKPDDDAAAPASTGDVANDNLDPDRAVEAMGIGETRTADPDTNPLEDKLDNLLDGVD
jgi:hypothetical protein